jgi:hypothetical protein
MKNMIGLILLTLFIFNISVPLTIGVQNIDHRGSFYAEIGLRDNEEAKLQLYGNSRDFRNRHIFYGTANLIDSERTFRFQGLTSRSIFIIQSAINNRIVNIIGSFNRFDDETQTVYGEWRGFIIGYDYTRGWIKASFN